MLVTIFSLAISTSTLHAQAPHVKLLKTINDAPLTSIYSASGSYAVSVTGSNVRILEFDMSGTFKVIHTETIGGAFDAQIHAKGKNIVVLIESSNPNKVTGIIIIGTGSNYAALSVDITAGNPQAYEVMHYATDEGLVFLQRYSTAITPSQYITKAGRLNFDGTYKADVAVQDGSSRYVKIIGDSKFTYGFSYRGTELFMERLNKTNLSYNNGYFIGPLYSTTTEVSDIMQNDSMIKIMLRKQDSLIEKNIRKDNGTSTETKIPATFPTGMLGEEYIFPRVYMVRDKIIQHTPDPFGNSTITGTSTFTSGYNRFTSFPVSPYFFLWVGSSIPPSKNDVRVLLMDEWLSIKETLNIGSANDMHNIRGGYQKDANTFVLYGEKFANGNMSNPQGVIYILGLENVGTEVEKTTNSRSVETIEVYPNPAKDVLNIKCADHDKIASIVLYDMRGYPVKKFDGNGTCEQTISLYRLASADYIVEIVLRGKKDSIRKKFVKL